VNEYVNFNKSLTEEISAIFTRIQVDQDEVHCTVNRAASGGSSTSTKYGSVVRGTLRDKEFETWSTLPSRSQAV